MSGARRWMYGGLFVVGMVIAGGLVVAINGSPSNVIGLPLFETRALLGGLGYPINGSPVTNV